ncbi:MAG: hypothetical protein IJ115_10150 [Erysipelotrichaceae bacterium]|nr:hypothetical protein [Erysipelotrichaceae bacterium]
MIEKLSELADEYDLENWDEIKDYDPIDGPYTSFSMNYDNHKFMVSTDQMPSDGLQILGTIWNTIVNYLDNATRVDNW